MLAQRRQKGFGFAYRHSPDEMQHAHSHGSRIEEEDGNGGMLV